MVQSQKIFTSLALLVFAFISIFGVNAAMNHEKNGQMGGCPFMGEMTAICSMNVVEHLSAWMQSFQTIPTKSYAAILLALLLVYSVFALIIKSIKERYNSSFIENRIVLATQHYSKIFNHLRTLFSKGILHSRIYA